MKLSELLKKCKTNFFLNNFFFDFTVIDLSADSRLVKIIIFLQQFQVIKKTVKNI